MALEVFLFPDRPISGAEAEEWAEREVYALLPREALETWPGSLAVVEGGAQAGRLVEAGLTFAEHAGLRALQVRGWWQGREMIGGVDWEEVARRFELEDTPLYLWKARSLPEAGVQAWLGDLERLGLQAQRGLLEGERMLVRAEPTQENAWACWLAAWRFGSRVALDLGMRRASLERAFTVLKERLPELPDSLLERSRETEGWGKEEVRAFRQK